MAALADDLREHEVRVCRDGIRGLIAILLAWRRHKPFDLLILDWVCPYIKGFRLAKIVRILEERQDSKRTLIALISSYGDSINRIQLNQAGADFYWIKPEQMLNIKALVAEALKAK